MKTKNVCRKSETKEGWTLTEKPQELIRVKQMQVEEKAGSGILKDVHLGKEAERHYNRSYLPVSQFSNQPLFIKKKTAV